METIKNNMNKELILEYIGKLEGNYEKLSAIGMYSNGALDALYAIKSFIEENEGEY